MRSRAFLALAVTFACIFQGSACRRERPVPDEDSTKPPPAPAVLSKAIEVEPAYGTAALSNDPDDPAIWVHPTEASRSLILGTMKTAAPAGAVVVFGIDGQIRQIISGIDRPNNIDVEYGCSLRAARLTLPWPPSG